MREPVPLMCQPSKTIQRSFVDQVKSIYRSLISDTLIGNADKLAEFHRNRVRTAELTFMLHLLMPGISWPISPWPMWP